MNRKIFNSVANQLDFSIKPKLDLTFGRSGSQAIIVSSRLDQKKNIIGIVKAFLERRPSLDRVQLVLCIRGIEDPRVDIAKLSKDEQFVLNEILDTIGRDLIGNNVHFLNVTSQLELAATFRYFADQAQYLRLHLLRTLWPSSNRSCCSRPSTSRDEKWRSIRNFFRWFWDPC